MDENLYDCWEFIYENSEDISLKISYYRENPLEPVMVENISTSKLKALVAKKKVYHIEFPCSFELVIHAVKDDLIYCVLYEKTAESAWKACEQFALSKRFPRYHGTLVFQGNIPEGFFDINVNEWGKLKSGLRVMV